MGRESNKKRRATQAETAREKAAAARAIQQRADQRRRALTVLSTVVVLALVGGIFAVVALTHKSKPTTLAANRQPAPTSVVGLVTHVPVKTLDAVGQGSIPQGAGPQPVTGAALTSSGKPEMLYIGAEFCPYCAAERWSMGVALSRFGKLSGVRTTSSSSTDVYPNTASLDFDGTTFASKYLTFTPVENLDRNHNALQSVSSAQSALWSHYEPGGQQGFPFIDFGNKYAVTSPTFLPTMLKGLTQAQIASKLATPTDPVAKAVDGTANLITAAICGMTNNQPATVCTDSTVSKLQSQINAQKTG
jgi:hypothetical protein